MADNTPQDGSTAGAMATIMNPDVDMSAMTGVPATNVPSPTPTGRPSPLGPPNVEAPNSAGIETSPTLGGTENGPGRRPVDTPAVAPQPPHPVSKMFDHILKTISGGPIYVNDPVTGQRREVQQTRGSMAKAITAAALSGLFAKQEYRPGAFGGVVRDPQASMANAFQAGKGVTEERKAEQQKIVDDQNTRRLMSIQNNTKQVTLAAAMAHQRGQDFDAVLDNTTKMLEPVQEAAKTIGADKVWEVPGGMTAQEVLNSGHSLTDNNVFATGKKFVNDENGVPQPELTYSIARNDFQVSLPEDITKELAKFDERFQNIYKATGGNVVLPVNAYIDRMHLGNRLINAESFINRLNTQVNGEGAAKIDLPAAYKKNPAMFGRALETLEHDMAAGKGRDEGTDDHLVQAMRGTPEGTALVGLVGDTSKTDAWAEEAAAKREREYQFQVGSGKAQAKALYAPITPTSAFGIASDPNQPLARRTQARAVLALQNQQKEVLAQFKQRLTEGNIDKLGYLVGMGFISPSQAKARGANPAMLTQLFSSAIKYNPNFNAQAAEDFFKSASNNQVATFFGSARSLTEQGGVLDQLVASHAQLGNMRLPIFNTYKDMLEFEAGDPALTGYHQMAMSAADDFAKVMTNGQPTQAIQLEQYNLLANKLNNQQLDSAVSSMRGAVKSQVNARAGNNYVMKAMYNWDGGIPGFAPPAPGTVDINPSAVKLPQNQPNHRQVPPPERFLDPKTNKPVTDGTPVYFPGVNQTWTLQNGAPKFVRAGK